MPDPVEIKFGPDHTLRGISVSREGGKVLLLIPTGPEVGIQANLSDREARDLANALILQADFSEGKT